VQYGKNCGKESNAAQDKVECFIGLETHGRMLFHKCGSTLTGLKHFWLTNTSFWLLLAIQNVAHMTNSAVFSVHGTEECCLEKNRLFV